ncbi:MAG: glycerol-3-phosphate acyltransferase [Acidobacteria bacterium]|nr:glycerol-3-phosphate acyltransferase [Acidobacteriota bacterium]
MPGDTVALVLCILFGYLLGSVPFSVLAGRRLAGVDVRQTGSRNPGAANVFRSVGRLAGAGVAIADTAKGALPVAVALAAGLTPFQAIWPGVAAVLGHDFPPYLRFRGGKGGATTLGFLACFVFPELVLVFLLWAILWVRVRRYRFLASIFALSLTPLLVTWFGWTWPVRLAGRQAMVWVSLGMIALLWVRVFPGLLEKARRD